MNYGPISLPPSGPVNWLGHRMVTLAFGPMGKMGIPAAGGRPNPLLADMADATWSVPSECGRLPWIWWREGSAQQQREKDSMNQLLMLANYLTLTLTPIFTNPNHIPSREDKITNHQTFLVTKKS
jgi:hypothetical protein